MRFGYWLKVGRNGLSAIEFVVNVEKARSRDRIIYDEVAFKDMTGSGSVLTRATLEAYASGALGGNPYAFREIRKMKSRLVSALWCREDNNGSRDAISFSLAYLSATNEFMGELYRCILGNGTGLEYDPFRTFYYMAWFVHMV